MKSESDSEKCEFLKVTAKIWETQSDSEKPVVQHLEVLTIFQHLESVGHQLTDWGSFQSCPTQGTWSYSQTLNNILGLRII